MKAAQRHIGRVVFTAGLCGPIGREVLHAGRHAAGPGQIAALITLAAELSPAPSPRPGCASWPRLPACVPSAGRARCPPWANKTSAPQRSMLRRPTAGGIIRPDRDRRSPPEPEGNGGDCPVAVEDIPAATRSGMWRRLFSTAARWKALVRLAPTTLSIDPRSPLAARSIGSILMRASGFLPGA